MTPGIWFGFDPSLTHFGFAVAHIAPAPFFDMHFIEVGVWATTPIKEDIDKTHGYARRCEFLAHCLCGLREKYGRPAGIALEGLALPFGETSMQTISALGRVRGILDGFSATLFIRCHEFAPANLKKIITGRRDSKKISVQRVVERVYPELVDLWPKRCSDIEHCADAVSAVHAVVLTTKEIHP